MQKFKRIIHKIGINPVIDPPEAVLKKIFERAGRTKGPIPVCGRLNGAEFVQTLIKYGGAWRLYINGQMLRSSGSKVGDIVNIEIDFDPESREISMPPKLRIALSKDKNAKTEFNKLPPSRKREIFRYLSSLKTAESVDRNVERVLLHLNDQDVPTLHGLMRKNRKRDV
jgi:hypothetical protein